MKISFYAEVEIPAGDCYTRSISTTVTLEGEAILELAKAITAVQHIVQSDGAGCACPNELAWQYSGGICLICNKPRR